MLSTPDYEEWKRLRKAKSVAFSPENMRQVLLMTKSLRASSGCSKGTTHWSSHVMAAQINISSSTIDRTSIVMRIAGHIWPSCLDRIVLTVDAGIPQDPAGSQQLGHGSIKIGSARTH